MLTTLSKVAVDSCVSKIIDTSLHLLVGHLGQVTGILSANLES